MKRPRALAGAAMALLFALCCLVAAGHPPRYALAQAGEVDSPQAIAAPAGVPASKVITYQGQLTDGGTPASGNHDFIFELWDDASAGTRIDKISLDDVAVADGLFTVQLAFVDTAFNGDARWLHIYAGPQDSVGIEDYTQLDPRQPLTPAPYAINASNADALGGLPPIAFARLLHDHWGQTWTGTESGVGLWLDGFAALPILRANNTGTGAGVAGVSAAAAGVYGETASTSVDKAAVYGVASDAADGVYGESAHGDGVSGNGGDGVGDFGGRFIGYAGVRGEGETGYGGYFKSTANDAVYAAGDVTITGDLTVLGAANIASYAQRVTVAKSGAEYATIQAAIDSVDDATAAKPYLVLVAPGVYEEPVTLKPHVHLQGAGREVTIITSDAGNSGLPATLATLKLSSSTSVRDLSVVNTGINQRNVALLAPASVTDVVVSNVTASAEGDNYYTYGILADGASTELWLENVTARGENGGGTGYCYGLYVDDAAATLRGGVYHALPLATTFGGYGIVVSGPTAVLDAEGVSVLGAGGENYAGGLRVEVGAQATLRGGEFAARGSDFAAGITVLQDNSTLIATDVTALAEDPLQDAYALHAYWGAGVTLHGGSFVARNGRVSGISISGATLLAENVAALAYSGSGRPVGLLLTAQDSGYPADVTLQGGAFTGTSYAEGYTAYGIYATAGTGAVTLLAERISAAGDGTISHGVVVAYSNATIEIAESVLRGTTTSVTREYGTVTVANARLSGVTSNNFTCVAVSRGTTFNASGCP